MDATHYPTAVIHFDFKVNETERQVSEVFVKTLQDAIAINADDDAMLAWIEAEAREAYARAFNLRARLKFGHLPKVEKNLGPDLSIYEEGK